MDKIKGCPLLPQNDTVPSYTVSGESHGRTFFLSCIQERCAAYKDGVCGVFGNEVKFDDRAKRNTK